MFHLYSCNFYSALYKVTAHVSGKQIDVHEQIEATYDACTVHAHGYTYLYK